MYKKWIGLTLMMSAAVAAHASIMIYPKFVFLDDKTKSGEVLLVNGDDTQVSNYRISLVYKKQNTDGTYTEPIDSQVAPQNSAIPFLRYSPRSVELEPRQSQVVRLLKRLPEDLPAGDYTAYITFTEVKPEQPKAAKPTSGKGINVQITPIPVFAIPVLLRHGVLPEDIHPTLKAGKLHYVNDKTFLPVRLGRVKTRKPLPTFLRGDISVWSGDKLLGQIKGKYLLPETKFVDVNIPLFEGENKWMNLKGKKLTVLFTPYDESKIDKTQILAQTEVKL